MGGTPPPRSHGTHVLGEGTKTMNGQVINNVRDSGDDSRPDFCNVGTTGILVWIILGCEGLSCVFQNT